MSIINQCMIVNLQIGMWLGYRLDKEASKAVTDMANADTDAARVNKHLVPKSALADITKAVGAIRNHFYAKTLPWKDNGDRLLTRAMYMPFIEEHERLVGLMHDAVDEFLSDKYPSAMQQAEFRMGDLHKPEDYPAVSVLRRKFYVNLDIDPVTDANDVRVRLSGIDQTQLDERVAQAEAAMQQRVGKAMIDVWSRLADVVSHFATKMDSDDIFRNSTVTNLQEIVELLPDLNVVDDPDLNRIIDEVRSKLTGYDPDDLRKNPAVRKLAADEAKTIINDMSGFMAAFGAE